MGKYEEALERARAGKPIDEVFLELKESEDERIRKAALKGIEYLEHKLGWDFIGDTDILDVKEYLERQKEQPTNEEMLRTLYAEYEKGVADTIAKYEQKKQKPAEWSEEDEDKLYQIIEILLADKEIARRDNPQHHDVLCKAYDELISWLKSLRPHWKPSEEHFQGLRRAITKAEKGSDAWNSLTDLYEQLKKL